MKKIALALTAAALAYAAPAHATGGLICRSAAGDVSLTISHTIAPVIVAARLSASGRIIPTALAQGWIDRSEIRLDLTDTNATRIEARLRAKRTGNFYEGALARRGMPARWVRCREG